MGDENKITVLNIENAKTVKTIRNINHPEWGKKRFNYNDQPLNDGENVSSWGVGVNSAILFESEYRFWEVIR